MSEWDDMNDPDLQDAADEEWQRQKDYKDHVAAALDKLRISAEARRQFDDEQQDASIDRQTRKLDGASFILDIPTDVPAIWGRGSEVIWARGEALILGGPPGVGKTTVAAQVTRARLGLTNSVLGLPVEPSTGRVLYLAMDRPQQIARALARCFTPAERDVLRDRLIVRTGPPPRDLAKHTELLTEMALEDGADTVVVDSLKDAALGLSDDEVGASYNRARQLALVNGIELLELHHVVKRGVNGAKPTTLADLYGSAWLTAGAGSVVLLWGEAGDPIVDLTHLKQPAAPIGPWKILHNHDAGTSTIWHATDLLAMAGRPGGITAKQAACATFDTDKPKPAQIEKARRRLESLTRDGQIVQLHQGSEAHSQAATWGRADLFHQGPAVPLTTPLTHPSPIQPPHDLTDPSRPNANPQVNDPPDPHDTPHDPHDQGPLTIGPLPIRGAVRSTPKTDSQMCPTCCQFTCNCKDQDAS